MFRVHALALIAVGWFCVWLCAPARLHFVHDSSTIEIVFGVIFPLTCVRRCSACPVGTTPAVTLTLPLARPSRGAAMLSVRRCCCFGHIARAQLSQPRLFVARRRAGAAIYTARAQLPAASRCRSPHLTSRCRPKLHAP